MTRVVTPQLIEARLRISREFFILKRFGDGLVSEMTRKINQCLYQGAIVLNRIG